MKKYFQLFLICESLLFNNVFAAENNLENLNHFSGLLLTSPNNSEVASKLNAIALNAAKNPGANLESLKTAKAALNIHKIKKTFDNCLNSSEGSKKLGSRIIDLAKSSSLEERPCFIQNDSEESQLKNLGKVSKKINDELKNFISDEARVQSQKNLIRTYVYWDQRIEAKEKNESVKEVCKKIKCREK
jgi:hypothetical protein